MTTQQAQSAVSLSAFVVAVVFAYRKLTEGSVSKAQPNQATVPATSHFVVGFGFTYIPLSIIAQAAPDLGGMFAVLVAVADLLVNGKGIVDDVNRGLKSQALPSTVRIAGPGLQPEQAPQPEGSVGAAGILQPGRLGQLEHTVQQPAQPEHTVQQPAQAPQ